jgi:ABC-type Fe2+-enterobactin transport system substrate-binding protein
MRTYSGENKVMNEKAATGIGTPMSVPDFQHLIMTLSTSASANFTIKFQGSFADVCPAFGSAQSDTNRWDYVQIKDLQNNSAIDGDTGVAFAGSDDVRQFEINTNGLKWVCPVITAYAAGKVSVRLQAFSNN